MESMTAQERQWYQIVPASGMSADFINEPMHCVDPIWSIRTRKDDTPQLRVEVQKRLKALETYTEYAERQRAQAKKNPEREFEIYVNEDNRLRVGSVDRLVREIKTEAEKLPEDMDILLLLDKVNRIDGIIRGRETPLQMIGDLRRLGY